MRIFWEFVRGFRTLHFVGPCVTVFGSARFTENHEYYKLARALGAELAKAGFTVMTGVNSPAVKTDACVVNHIVNEISIQCLASQLPEFLTVDLGNLTKGQSLHMSDIQLPPGIKIVTHGKPNPVIVSANVQAAEVEEVAPAPVVAAAVPAPTKAKKTEKQNKK